MTNDANPLARILVPSSERLFPDRSSFFSLVKKGSASAKPTISVAVQAQLWNLSGSIPRSTKRTFRPPLAPDQNGDPSWHVCPICLEVTCLRLCMACTSSMLDLSTMSSIHPVRSRSRSDPSGTRPEQLLSIWWQQQSLCSFAGPYQNTPGKHATN